MNKGQLHSVGLLAVCACVFLPAVAQTADPQAQQQAAARHFYPEARHAVSVPLREMPTVLEQLPPPRVEHEPLRLPPLRGTTTNAAFRPDAALHFGQSVQSPAPALGLNIPGEGISLPAIGGGPSLGGDPSDSEGKVGDKQYVEWINTFIAVFDKKTGALVSGPTAGNNLFAALGGDCASLNDGDPIAQFDHFANRWVLAQFAVNNGFSDPKTGKSAPFHECVAVSTSDDATGAYNLYDFTYADFNDYPKIGVWPDKLLVTFNLFQPPAVPLSQNPKQSLNFVGGLMCAYDKANMEAGNPANQACAPPNTNDGGILPSDVDGSTLPPSGELGFFLALDNNTSLDLFGVTGVNFATGTLSVSAPNIIQVPAFTPACNNTGTCIPQNDGGNQPLDSLGDRVMYRLAYRNFGAHDALLANHSVDITNTGSGQSGVRWYEIRNPGSSPTVFQTGTYAPDPNFRWMASMAMDKAGNVAAGYSVSSRTMDPSIFISTRAPSDPAGVLGNETLIQQGSFATGDNRWGDYTAMTVDPVDDCTLWYVNQFLQNPPGGQFDWDTKIVNFQMPNCVVAAKFGVQPSSTNAVAGTAIGLTVTAEDPNGQTVFGYAGTVHFTSSDPAAQLPPDYTFVPSVDSGTHPFNGIAFTRAGNQNVTVTDTLNGNNGNSGAISVSPGPATHFTVTPSTSTPTAGASFTIAVTAFDQFGNQATNYTGTVKFTSSDRQAQFPMNNVTLANGTGAFGVTLKTAGTQTVTATDSVSSFIGGMAEVQVKPAAASHFVLATPSTAKAGLQFTIRVTATDPFGNLDTNYGGTVMFSASGTTASLPANSPLPGGNAKFTVTATSNGTLTLTATDTVKVAITGSAMIAVSANDPMLHALPAKKIAIFRGRPSFPALQVIVASFVDDDSAETGTNLTATINWGDGNTDSGVMPQPVAGSVPNSFNVLGSHAYAKKGEFTVTVTITDSANPGTPVVIGSTAKFLPRNFAF